MQKTLDKLLDLAPPSLDWELGDSPTLADLGIDASDAYDLIAIAKREHLVDLENDDPGDAYFDAPIHAYRLLAEMRDPAHIPVFLELLIEYNNLPEFDIYFEEVLEFLPLLGEPLVAPALAMQNDEHQDEAVRIYCAEILNVLAKENIATETIIKGSTEYLSEKHYTRKLNASITATLVDLKASSEIDTIRACYQAHLADITINGDLESVEMELGLRETRTTEKPNWNELEEKEHCLARKELLGPLPDGADFVTRFVYLFDLHRRDCSVHSAMAIEAMLTGLLLSPTLIPPSQFYPLIWDTSYDKTTSTYKPVWENEDDAKFFTTSLMVMHNNLVGALETGNIALPNDEFDDREAQEACISWLLWLNQGVSHWHKVNKPEDIDPDIVELISVSASIMNAIGSSQKSGKISALTSKLKKLLSSIYKRNKSTGMSARPFSFGFSPGEDRHGNYSEPQHRDTPKISRNAPCPCGSGKKYKRCCMS